MEKTITKRTVNKGIEVTVVIREQRYDVYIVITTEADISQKIKCENFSLKFFLSKGAKLDKAIHLERKNLRLRKESPNVHSLIEFRGEDYLCKVSLSPRLYVPNQVIAISEAKKKEKTKTRNKKIHINDKYRPGLSVYKGGAKYSKNNITRPYQGGRCSPK